MSLFYRNGFNFASHTFGQSLHRHAGTGGLGGEELGVDFVEGSEIAHIRQEAGGLDDPVKAGARSFQNRTYILAALLRLGGDAFGDGAGGRIYILCLLCLLLISPYFNCEDDYRLSTASFSCAMAFSRVERGQAAFSRMKPVRLRPKV